MAIAIDLADRTAWVTGGASGIGAAVAARLEEAGARVVSLDRAHPTGDSSRVPLDITDLDAVQLVARDLIARGLAPDVLVNGAGISRDATVWNLNDAQWDDVLAVNLTGAFRMIRAVAPSMRERRCGAIVNIASINGIRGKFGQANYAASKGGLIALTKTAARELGGRGVRVNAIAPGMIETPMTRSLPIDVHERAKAETVLRRLGQPDDVASAVLFLVSPLAAHITGQVLVVDGGQLI